MSAPASPHTPCRKQDPALPKAVRALPLRTLGASLKRKLLIYFYFGVLSNGKNISLGANPYEYCDRHQ